MYSFVLAFCICFSYCDACVHLYLYLILIRIGCVCLSILFLCTPSAGVALCAILTFTDHAGSNLVVQPGMTAWKVVLAGYIGNTKNLVRLTVEGS